MEISADLLKVLVCPISKSKKLKYDRIAKEIISEDAGVAYPIREGIPIMLADQARKLKSNEEKATA